MLAGAPAYAQGSPPSLIGYVSERWGAYDVNRCVPDVSRGLTALESPGDLLGFRLQRRQGFNRLSSHWQGVLRLSAGGGDWLALTRSGAPVGFVLVRMGSRQVDGLAWRSNRPGPAWAPRGLPPPAEDTEVQTLPPPSGFEHGGGLGAVGRILAVPYEGGHGSVIALYDMSDPSHPRLLHAFDRFGVARPSSPEAASAVGITKLADGRYLMVVGAFSSKVLDFYLSEGTTLLADQIAFRWIQTLRGAVAGGFQNLSLITQCDGAIFLVGTHNTSLPPPALGRDFVRWYRLSSGAGGGVAIQAAGSRHMDCSRCNFAAAAGLYVDPAGRLILYATEHGASGPGGSVEFEEFRSSESEAEEPLLAPAHLHPDRDETRQ